MTPRMACWLWTAATYLADMWRDNRDESEYIEDYFPVVARPFAHGEWLDRVIDCFDTLATRIASGVTMEFPTCTAEELALHIVIDTAANDLNDGMQSPSDGIAATLPDYGDDDLDFDLTRDLLLKDFDVLMLFNPTLDGVEDDDGEMAQHHRMINLHPRDWFTPFADR